MYVQSILLCASGNLKAVRLCSVVLGIAEAAEAMLLVSAAQGAGFTGTGTCCNMAYMLAIACPHRPEVTLLDLSAIICSPDRIGPVFALACCCFTGKESLQCT